MTTISPGDVRRARIIAASLVAVILTAAVLSVTSLAFRPALLSEHAAVQQARGNQINDDVKTSFGIVAVEFVRQVDGLTHRSLAGASHGVSGLVNGDHAQIQVAVAITNRTEKPIEYTSKQFALQITRKGRTTTQAVGGGDLPDSRVLPHAGIEGHLSFTLPRKAASLALLFHDPGRAEPILIHLGPAHFRAPRDDLHHTH